MSSKIVFATAIMAASSFLFIDTADAQRRGGAERGGEATAEAGGRRGGARQNRGERRGARGNRQPRTQAQAPRRNAGEARGGRRNAQNNQVRGQRTPRVRANRGPDRAAPRFARGPGRDFDRPRRGWLRGLDVRRAWRARPPWLGGGYRGRACSAVARTNGGTGYAVRGTYGDGYGRRACRKALNECNLKLDYRQARGRNPFARCVVASR